MATRQLVKEVGLVFLKFVCCDVFTRIACDLVAKSPHIIDMEFVPMLAHKEPDKLRMMIQRIIDFSILESGRTYDAVILGFGLCGNAAVGLSCPVPMVIPRAHDCCTIHMGCKERFIDVFGTRLSSRWCSTGYFERSHIVNSGYFDEDQLANYKTSAEYMGYVEQYGEEDADYIWGTLHPHIESKEAFYIEIKGFEYSDAYESYKARVEKEDRELIKVKGDIALLQSLIGGEWSEERFLIVPPDKKITGVYDMDEVMKAEGL
jgi:hypothetical protein